MKKLILLSAAVLALSAQARELTFFLGDTEVKPGETLIFNDITKEPAGTGFDVVMAPELYVHSDIVTSNVTITAECTSGQSIQMCCGGDCMAGTTVTKTGLRIGTNDKLALDFEYTDFILADAAIPTVTTTFTAVDPKYPDTQVTMTLEMNKQSGVASVTVSQNTIAAVNGGIKYDVDGHATLCLIDITGRTVLREAVEGSGVLSTSSLPRGLYIYRLTGASNLSGKLQLR